MKSKKEKREKFQDEKIGPFSFACVFCGLAFAFIAAGLAILVVMRIMYPSLWG